MTNRKTAKTRRAAAQPGARDRRPAFTLGWYLFLATVALVPVAMGALPPQFGALATIRAYDPFSLTKTVWLLILAGLSLAAFCVAAVRREADVYWHPVLWIVAGMTGWTAVSAAFSPSWGLSIWGAQGRNEGLVAAVGYAIVAFLAVQFVRSTRALRMLMTAAVVSGVLVSLYAIAQFFGTDPWAWLNEPGRAASTFGNADMLGTYLLLPLPFAVGLALSAPKRSLSIAWWVAAALLIGALAASGTRGAWIGAIAMGLAVVLVGWGDVLARSRWREIAFASIAVALVAAAVGVVLMRARLGWASASLPTKLSNGRTVIWLIGLRAWLARPIAGWGPDGFARAFVSAVGPSWYALVRGYVSVDNAHSMLVERLVTLGLPGLVLTLWAIIQTAVVSVRDVREQGPARPLRLAVWAALVGLTVALCFGVTVPEVSVWLWMSVGLLLALSARPVPRVHAALLAASAAVGVALAVLAGTWLAADVMVGRAMQLPAGPDRVARLEAAVRVNPLPQIYRGLVADTLLNQAIAEQQSGAGRQIYDGTIRQAIAAYEEAAAADKGDAIIRAALANLLIGYSRNNPTSDAASRAVQVMEQAVALAPHDAAVLVTLARAYQAAGRMDDAQKTANLARQVAPDYASQALDPLGLGGTASP